MCSFCRRCPPAILAGITYRNAFSFFPPLCSLCSPSPLQLVATTDGGHPKTLLTPSLLLLPFCSPLLSLGPFAHAADGDVKPFCPFVPLYPRNLGPFSAIWGLLRGFVPFLGICSLFFVIWSLFQEFGALNIALNRALKSALNRALNIALNTVLNTALKSALNRALNIALNTALKSALNRGLNIALKSALNTALRSVLYTALNIALKSALNRVFFRDWGLFWDSGPFLGIWGFFQEFTAFFMDSVLFQGFAAFSGTCSLYRGFGDSQSFRGFTDFFTPFAPFAPPSLPLL